MHVIVSVLIMTDVVCAMYYVVVVAAIEAHPCQAPCIKNPTTLVQDLFDEYGLNEEEEEDADDE